MGRYRCMGRSTAVDGRGRGILALSEDKKIKRGADGRSRDGASGKTDRDVGHALRSVYSITVNEEIPSELLALLSKLD